MKVLIKKHQLSHHLNPIGNLIQGIRKHTDCIVEKSDMDLSKVSKADFGVCWGLRNFYYLRKYVKNILVIENAYINNVQGHNKEWLSVGWNGLNGRANFYNSNSPSDRWKKHFDDGRLLDYSDGEYILIPIQIRGDQSLRHVKRTINYQTICENIRKYTDLPIVLKDHPTRPGTQPKVVGIKNLKYINSNIPISEAIKNAKVVVTINSNSGVDALIGGKPVISLDHGSMVWDIAEKDFMRINFPRWKDRTQWCNNISYAQWHPDEFKSGEVWDHLKQHLDYDD